MEENQLGYDEDQAVKFIRAFVPQNISQKYSDDEILFIIDTIWDYYESKGMLEISADIEEEDLLNVDDLTKYVEKEVKKDGELMMDHADISYIVKGELAYEESLEDTLD